MIIWMRGLQENIFLLKSAVQISTVKADHGQAFQAMGTASTRISKPGGTSYAEGTGKWPVWQKHNTLFP